jgi:hypothetical protein
LAGIATMFRIVRQHVDAAKLTIGRVANRAFDGGSGIGAS